tara:strand:- start:10424 stop:11770 length:1347 start_codon:yes stop_codon:yes gene_type:complete
LIILLFFGIAIAGATFVENDYGTDAARALVFNSWWLELMLVLLCSIFIYNIFEYKLYHLRKMPVLFLHLSFIFIIIGAGITRYVSKEGAMRIREGNLNNQFVSVNQFLEFKIHDGVNQYSSSKEVLFSSITDNHFTIPINFQNHKIHIESIDFIHDPIDEVVGDQSNGNNIIELIVPSSSGGMKSEYLLKKTNKDIQGLSVGFDVKSDLDFNIFQKDSLFYFTSPYDIEYMKMSDQSMGKLIKNTNHILNHKTLYTISGNKVVFKNHFTNSVLRKKSSGLKNDQSKLDLLKIKVSVMEKDTVIDLYGSKGVISSKEYFQFNNLFFSISYGPKIYSLPFAIFLKDFQLDRYPGSDSPSSFASEIEVLDGDNQFNYRIFMNNVLNYKGYRFFQSSYDEDEQGTILSVNQDKWGTMVTYFGYLSLLLSVISVMLSRFSRINLLNKKINQSI